MKDLTEEYGELSQELEALTQSGGDLSARNDIMERMREIEEELLALTKERAALDKEAAQERLNAALQEAEARGGRAIGAAVPETEQDPNELLSMEQRMAILRSARAAERLEEERRLTEELRIETEKRLQLDEDEARSKAQLTSALSRAASTTLNLVAGQNQKLKGLRVAAAVADTYAGANRAFAEHPYPLSAAIAATIIASGLANVQSIISGNPSGAGGTTATGGGAAPAQPQPERQAFNVEFRSGTGLYEESSLRRLFDALQEASEDGDAGLSGRFVVQGI